MHHFCHDIGWISDTKRPKLEKDSNVKKISAPLRPNSGTNEVRFTVSLHMYFNSVPPAGESKISHPHPHSLADYEPR